MADVNTKRKLRKKRARRKIGKGTSERPRLSVFRSNKHIYAQIIDDGNNTTVVSASSMDMKSSKKEKAEIAYAVGELAAKKAKDTGISKVVFDKGPYKFHGRVKALAEGARKGGLQF